ncbi:MAG: hypothetical protein EOP09_03115 [Proteobacteria bacterium]|nr:MAG: hypothetical protein EOP09_03115 [Pseudomonadota bacterium]
MNRFTMMSLLLVSSLSFTACRVKNEQTTQLYGYDTLSGYYSTSLQTVQATVKLKGQTARVVTLPFTYAYSDIVEVMSDPVMFYFEDPIKGIASIRNASSTDKGFSIRADAQSMALSYSSASSVNVSGCKLTEEVLRNGNLTDGAGSRNGYQTRGSMRLDYAMEYSWTAQTADCSDALANFFATCYAE